MIACNTNSWISNYKTYNSIPYKDDVMYRDDVDTLYNMIMNHSRLVYKNQENKLQ